ncbi:peptidoglycan bridge formation glycyltransferase FemA/FemB family protein, partial [Staphylococcus epidermidis]|uniref:peptidoglycan bridge formation glycyltransferase FemA/FemB family protein n=1 Tax=Staphylococcus epidermidis TaxID=1282 RepID=UPI0037DA6BCF
MPHLHKQIHHHKKQFLQPSQLPQTHPQILNLPSRLYFPNPYQLNYFSPPSSQKYNQYIPPYPIHSHIINYSFHNPYHTY